MQASRGGERCAVDLAQIGDLASLLPLLTKPQEDSLEEFSRELVVVEEAPNNTELHIGAQVLSALGSIYGASAAPVAWIPATEQRKDEGLLLALWSQMWPALRRDCAFLSLASEQSVEFGASCTLRLADRLRPPDGPAEISRGLYVMAEDISSDRRRGLRTFLSNYITEAPSPREDAPVLAEFFSSFFEVNHGTAHLDSLEELSRKLRLPRLIRDVCGAVLAHAGSVEEIARVLELAEALDATSSLASSQIDLEKLSDEESSFLISSLAGTQRTDWVRELRSRLISRASLNALLSLVSRGEPAVELVTARPDLALTQDFWPKRDWDRADLLRRVVDVSPEPLPVFELLAPEAGSSVARVIASNVGKPQDVARLYKLSSHELQARLLEWVVRSDHRFYEFLSATAMEQLLVLAHVHMHSGTSSVSSHAWAEALMAYEDLRGPELPAELFLLGYASALRLDRERGFFVAQRFLPKLIHACRKKSIGDREWWFLERNVPGGSSKWSRVKTLYRSAQFKWAGWNFDPSLLSLFPDFDMASEFLQECESIVGWRKIAQVAQLLKSHGREAKLLKKYVDSRS